MQTTRNETPVIEKSLNAVELLDLQNLVRQVPVTLHVANYASSLVRATRPKDPTAPDFIKTMVDWGAGPRAGQFLINGGKSLAAMDGRFSVAIEDVRKIAVPVLRHRLVVSFAAESDGVTSDDIVQRLIDMTPTKEDELTSDARFQKIFAS